MGFLLVLLVMLAVCAVCRHFRFCVDMSDFVFTCSNLCWHAFGGGVGLRWCTGSMDISLFWVLSLFVVQSCWDMFPIVLGFGVFRLSDVLFLALCRYCPLPLLAMLAVCYFLCCVLLPLLCVASFGGVLVTWAAL